MKQQAHQNTATAIVSRQTKLINRFNELQLQVDVLDDDGQLSQSSGRIRDFFSMIFSRENGSHRSTAHLNRNNEDNQLRLNLEQQKSSTAHTHPPPAIPPRPGRPTIFLQQSTALQINFEHFVGTHQKRKENQNRNQSTRAESCRN